MSTSKQQLNLSYSQWAPRTVRSTGSAVKNKSASSAHGRHIVTREESLRKIQRLLDRLSWKAELLQISFERAESGMASRQPPLHDNVGSGVQTGPRIGSRARTMFKLDFYEFYVLLERVLVLFLEYFHVPLGDYITLELWHPNPALNLKTSSSPSNNAKVDSMAAGNEEKREQYQRQPYVPRYEHRYHANILDKFQEPSNPLHDLLGKDEVFRYLLQAKNMRNKWKDSDVDEEHDEERARAPIRTEGGNQDSQDLDLEGMTRTIIEALKEAYRLAAGEAARATKIDPDTTRRLEEEWQRGVMEGWIPLDMDMDMDDIPFEAVDDMMEWE